jgi:type IV pilus assembly protein PilA
MRRRYVQSRCAENVENPRGGGHCLRNAAPLEGGCSRVAGLKVKRVLPYVGNTKKNIKRGVKPHMPTKVKGMTSIEIAILVAIVLAIAVAVAWYLYTTYAASVGSQPLLRIVSAIAYPNGTIVIDVVNIGSSDVLIWHTEVFGTLYNTWTYIPPGGQTTLRAHTGRWIRQGSIIQGRLITEGGHSFPFTARTIST